MTEHDLILMPPEVFEVLARIHARKDLTVSHYDALESFIREQRDKAYNEGYRDGVKDSQ